MPDALEPLFAALARSAFRSRFKLGPRERGYLESRGMAVVMDHAHTFIALRLAPAHPTNDGKQTPMRGHPVFIAQHATATCCRGCLEKWHALKRGEPLDAKRAAYIAHVIETWLRRQSGA